MSSDEVRLIASDELAGLQVEWERLWVEAPDASPFQSSAWVLSWAKVYAPGRCWAAALRWGGRLAALIPVFVWERALLLAGTGPSDHASALFAPGAERAVADLVRVLAESSPEPFERIDLQQLPPRSPLASVEPPAFAAAEEAGEACLVLPLSGAAGMGGVPKRMRSNWRYAVRRIEREGLTLDLVAQEDAAEGAAELERLHQLRWRAEGEEGVLDDDLPARHLRLAIPRLARAGLLRMHRLRRGAETIAILFAMRGKSSTCYYLSGFDPEWAWLSPGTILVGAAIAEAAREGCSAFDFLRGEEEYKLKWGAAATPRLRRVLTPLQVRSVARSLLRIIC